MKLRKFIYYKVFRHFAHDYDKSTGQYLEL